MTTTACVRVIEQLKPTFSNVSNGRAKVDQLPEDARIIEDIGLASLDLLELRFELEAVWNPTITDEEAISLKTVSNVVDLIIEKSMTERP
jgi:acyl carrier protein